MDPQLEDYLNKILSSLNAIAQNQEKQSQEFSNLAQQVETMKSSIPLQNDKHERIHSLTELNVYKPDVGGDSEQTDQRWTCESLASSLPQIAGDLQVSLSQLSHSVQDILTEVKTLISHQTDSMNSTLEDERYFLKDQLGNTQAEILERLEIFQQMSISLQHRQAEDSEVDVSAPTEVSSSTLEEFRAVCKDLESCVRGVTRMELIWLEKEVKDKSSVLENTVTDQIAALDEKMMSSDKILLEALRNKILELRIKLAKDIRKSVTEKFTETVTERQMSTEENIERSSHQSRMSPSYFGSSLLLIVFFVLFSYVCLPYNKSCIEC